MFRKRLGSIDKKWKEYALAGCICILFFVIITNLSSIWTAVSGFLKIFKPLLIGFVLAYVMNPLAVFFQKKLFRRIRRRKLRWNLSVFLAFLLVLLLIVLFMVLLIPQLADSIVSLADNYTGYMKQLKKFIAGLKGPLLNQEVLNEWIDSITAEGGLLSKIGSFVSENAKEIIQKTTHVGAAAVNGLIGAIFAIYFLTTKKSILKFLSNNFTLLLKKETHEKLKVLLYKFNTIFSKYIVCELLDAFIIGAVTDMFMVILKMPDALIVSVAVGLTNLAPTFGPLVGAGIGSFILLLVKPTAVIPFLIFTVILQTLDGYVIKPKLFGGVLNVPGVLILIAIIVFGKLMGVTGMLIAIPVAAVLVYLYDEQIFPKMLQYRKMRDNRDGADEEGEVYDSDDFDEVFEDGLEEEVKAEEPVRVSKTKGRNGNTDRTLR